MSDPMAEVMRNLRREYLKGAPERIRELRTLFAAVQRKETGAVDGLRRAFHKLAGSGGSYGFESISTTSRAGEHLAQAVLDRTDGKAEPVDVTALSDSVEAVVRAIDAAQANPGQ